MPPPDYLEPSFGPRLVARLVDGLILLPAVVIAIVAGFPIVALGIGASYEVLLIARDGQTIGKRLLRLRVVDATSGEIPTTDQAARRWLMVGGVGAVISLFAPGAASGIYDLVVLLPILQPPLHRGLHDRAAGTIVTRLDRH